MSQELRWVIILGKWNVDRPCDPAESCSRIGLSTNKFKELQVEASRTAYCKVATDLVMYILGVVAGETPQFKTSLTPETVDAAETFMDTLYTTEEDDQDDALQALLFALFNQKLFIDDGKYASPTYSFLVLYSFTEEGALRSCNAISQYFSKVIFFARGAIFNRITSDAKSKRMGFFE